ncbi:hypothetical protein KR054_000999 [Drosophila jambulina]|nr:hypothetical protein KR054_000999 [Drosophila jambulina]
MQRYRSTNYIRSPQKGTLVDRSLELRRQNTEAAYYFKWSCINLLLLIILSIDIMLMDRSCCPKSRYRLVYMGSIFETFTFLACFIKYLHIVFKSELGVGTEEQKRLLDGKDDSGIDTILNLPNIEPPICQEDRALIIKSTKPLMRSYALKSCLLNQKSSKIPKAERRAARPEDYLTDPCQLPALIKRVKWERRLLEESVREPKFQTWARKEMSQQLRSTIYELSPPPVSNRPITFEEFGTAHTQKCSIDPARFYSPQMMQYMVNLRSWLQTTILKRLVREMDFVNNVLQQRGFPGFEFGTVSLDTLRRTVEGQRIMLPALPTVLAFLNLPGDQLYLVQRIRELEKSLPDSWSSGLRVPNDAVIIFHLFCVYLDAQLMPFLGYGPQFSCRYVIHGKPGHFTKHIIGAVTNCANFAFLVTSGEDQRRLRFDYICGGELHRCFDQRDSPFQVMIEFLMHMRQHQDSTLEGVSLGKNGINIMWVIGEP